MKELICGLSLWAFTEEMEDLKKYYWDYLKHQEYHKQGKSKAKSESRRTQLTGELNGSEMPLIYLPSSIQTSSNSSPCNSQRIHKSSTIETLTDYFQFNLIVICSRKNEHEPPTNSTDFRYDNGFACCWVRVKFDVGLDQPFHCAPTPLLIASVVSCIWDKKTLS